jgi:hypothetical protein
MVSFMVFTASVQNILDTNTYRVYLTCLDIIQGSVRHIRIKKTSYEFMSESEWFFSLIERSYSTIKTFTV